MKSETASKILFLHLRKTAGTTLKNVILRNYPPGAVFTVYGRHAGSHEPGDLAKLPRRRKEGLDAVIGHFRFGMHRELPGGFRYVTLLRDPVERLVSLYYHYLRYPASDMNNPVKSGRFSLLDFAAGRGIEDGGNAQTFWIAGDANGGGPEARFRTALENLDNHFILAGLTEYFDESMVLLRKKLGWKRAGYRPWNVNLERVGRERLSPRILREVQRANALDIELYEAARKRLVRETRFCKGFEKELERQQSANRAYRKNERENIDCGQTRQLENKRDKNVAEIYELAEYHYRSGALDKALLWFKGLLRKRDVPPHLEFGARILVSEILEKRGDPSWRRWLRRALARFQNEKPATELRMYRVGSAYRKLGDPEKAGMWFSRLVESKPWNAPIVSGAYFHLGEMRLESGDPAGALECFERCLDYNPRHEKAGILKKTLSGFGGQGRRNRER